MKKILICSTLLILSIIPFSCKDYLDVLPENIVQEDLIFSNESGTDAYLANIYNYLPIEDYVTYRPAGMKATSYVAHLSDEATNAVVDEVTSLGAGTTWSGFWASTNLNQPFGYTGIRALNDFLVKLPASSLPAAVKERLTGEARFLRAYYYFGLCKRFGGVPLITQPQLWTGDNLSEIQVPRNREQEVYDFIAKELDEASLVLPDVSPVGRTNKYVALALKSRIMLYAASIAKYGTVQQNGMLGIPATDANTYWKAAYDAAKKVIDGGKYALYTGNADKIQNFTELFLAAPATNKEAIFVKQYRYPDKAHNYDRDNLPYAVKAGAGYSSRINPTLELVEAFEYKDGTAGTLRINDLSNNPVKYSNPLDLFKDKDPRLAGSVILPFSQWKGTVIDVQAGLFHGNLTSPIVSGSFDALYDPVDKRIEPASTGGTIPVIGRNGIGGTNEVSQTGFYLRKQLNPAYSPSDLSGGSRSDQHYMDIRYAEVLLNYAEAAIELDIKADAKWAVNLVRERAGIRPLVDAEVLRDRIRNERRVELAFENHRIWDIRRWRIANSLINNYRFTALYPYKVLDDNTYVFKTQKIAGAKTFETRFYYDRIDPNEMVRNPMLLPNNPGY